MWDCFFFDYHCEQRIIMLQNAKYTLFVALVALLLCTAFILHKHLSTTAVPQFASSANGQISISAVGDIMMPGSIQNAVAHHKFRYDLLFEKIAADLATADLTIANLETTVDHESPVSGYPRFNARPELLSALKNVGVSIVSVANNHIMDAGVEGLKRTLNNIEKAGLSFIGAGRTKAEAEKIVYATRQGITTAFLAFTYDTNAPMPRKKGDRPVVNILRTNDETGLERAAMAVRRARQTADLVIVSIHWSDEYRKAPTRWQRRTAAALIESGADIILGHHPHVLQPIEFYRARDGRQGLISFSLGNFISSQNQGISNDTRSHAKALRGDGIILTIIAVKENGKTLVKRADVLPIWTLRDTVDQTVVYRPVSLLREIARIEWKPNRTNEEENTLKLLGFRSKVINDMLKANTRQQ
jgi:poly-gamma-glutamate capsule biosynthesis protein CapA/YwtB (metallophosphatase superfamily)